MTVNELKPYLRAGVHAHLVGIGGVSMAPLAEVLHGLGMGSPAPTCGRAPQSPISRAGHPHFYRSRGENIRGAELIIRTAAAHDTNPEIAAARAGGIPVLNGRRPGALMGDYAHALCISGTHGKTTTTSMCTHIAMAADIDPTVTIGTLPLLEAGHRWAEATPSFWSPANTATPSCPSVPPCGHPEHRSRPSGLLQRIWPTWSIPSTPSPAWSPLTAW